MSDCQPDKAERRGAQKALANDSRKPLLRRVKLGGKRWKVFEVPRVLIPGTHGLCFEDTQEIYVSAQDRGEVALDTLIHEALHAQMDYLTEAKVRAQAAELARLLWRLGYRKEKA